MCCLMSVSVSGSIVIVSEIYRGRSLVKEQQSPSGDLIGAMDIRDNCGFGISVGRFCGEFRPAPPGPTRLAHHTLLGPFW